jgi:hypothetical protein
MVDLLQPPVHPAEFNVERQRDALEATFQRGWRRVSDGQRRPYVRGLREDFTLSVDRSGPVAHVVMLFTHESFPGVRFGHRFRPPPDEFEDIEFMEDVETGGLLASLTAPVPAAGGGNGPGAEGGSDERAWTGGDPTEHIVWTSFGFQPGG